MTLANTTRNSRVYVITSTPGGVSLEQIVTDGTTANASAPIMVGSIYAPGVSFGAVAGDESSSLMTFSGGLLSLTMHDCTQLAAAGHNVTVGMGDYATDALSMTFNNAYDLDVQSQMPIASFTAASYTGDVGTTTGTPEIHTTAYIGQVTISGNFTGIAGTVVPEIVADSANPANGYGIGSIRVGGNMDSAQFIAGTGKIGTVSIGGHMNNSAEVNANSALGTVSVGGYMDNGSEIYDSYGGIGAVTVGGYVDHTSLIEVEGNGNIGAGGNPRQHDGYLGHRRGK